MIRNVVAGRLRQADDAGYWTTHHLLLLDVDRSSVYRVSTRR